ncbi:MAG: dihydrofolate reductase family protein, partial [Terriglobia bacterium]
MAGGQEAAGISGTAYVATSVDGFIARADGAVDWLPSEGGEESGEDYGYTGFMASVDAIVMGRKTYDAVRSLGPWSYGEKPVIVLGGRLVEIPQSLAETVQHMDATPREVFRRLAERGFSHIYVDGGVTIQGFLREGLIKTLIITVIPILIGAGIPLFGPLAADVRLRHVQTRQFADGLVQNTY